MVGMRRRKFITLLGGAAAAPAILCPLGARAKPQTKLPRIGTQLVRRPVDVIATYGTAASFAAKQATTTIPIVMISVGDPVRAGLVTSLARPGGNVTGSTILGPDIGAKWVQVLPETIAGGGGVA